MDQPSAYKSVSPFDGKLRIFPRGGRRDRRGRVSTGLSRIEVDKLVHAVSRSVANGLPFNRFVTIHWEKAGVIPQRRARATTDFLKLARDWLRASGATLAYVWIRENDNGDGRKGDHVHLLLHLPDGVSLARMQRRWINRISGKPYKKGVIDTRSIAGSLKAAQTMPTLYGQNLQRVAYYVLKGAPKGLRDAYALDRWNEGGRVIGQRVGMSKNLARQISGQPVSR